MKSNKREIIKNLSKIAIEPEINGLIERYNLIINLLPVSFWNLFTSKILDKAGNLLYDDIVAQIEDAACECGYYTGNGIIHSDEFKATCSGFIKNKEELLEALFVVIAGFGWAKTEIIQLIPEELLIVRAYDYYEADIYNSFENKKFKAFMLNGVYRAFMDLVYGKSFPEGIRSYKCTQTKGIEVGNFYGEFVITRK